MNSNKNWTTTASLIPVTNRKFFYLIVLLGAYFLYQYPVFKNETLLKTQGTICNVLLFVLAITLFYKDTTTFFNKSKGIPHIFELSFWLFGATLAVDIVCSLFINVSDPQNLARFTYDFSLPFVTYNVIKYVFVGLGEECFKLFIFLLIFSLLNRLIKRRHVLTLCVISVILASFIFGALHNFYAPENWVAITIPISASAMVYFYFLLKHKTIFPLMIAHAFQDIFVFLSLMNNYDELIVSIIQLGLMLIFILLCLKSIIVHKRFA